MLTPPPPKPDFDQAMHYVATWAVADHDSLDNIHRSGNQFFGTLGSLDFQYSNEDQVLHVWAFVAPGMANLNDKLLPFKEHLDQLAKQSPEETGDGFFVVKTLPWNQQATPDMDPCLYLRADIDEAGVKDNDIIFRFKKLSASAFTWHGGKLTKDMLAFYRVHRNTKAAQPEL